MGEAPDAEEIDLDGYGKRISESATLLPAHCVVTRVHFISKWNLFFIVRRKEPNLCVQW